MAAGRVVGLYEGGDAPRGGDRVAGVGRHRAVPGTERVEVHARVSGPGADPLVAGCGHPPRAISPVRGRVVDRHPWCEGAMSEPPDRAAFYAMAPGGWRDYWTLLHPPYTVWHLSYVVI